MSKFETIGLFPAAGHANRLGSSPQGESLQGKPVAVNQSKEILAVPDFNNLADDSPDVAVGDYLVQAYSDAGITDIVIIRRPEKSDIATHYSHARYAALSVQTVLTAATPGTPHTLRKAFDLYQHHVVALGFPDIILRAPDLFKKLLAELQDSAADICLALFPAADPANCDTVATQGQKVTAIEIKNPQSPYRYSWYCAVWQPRFSRFLRDFIDNEAANTNAGGELYVGHVLLAAMRENFVVHQVTFEDGLAMDIGRLEDLQRARTLGSE